MLISMVWFKHIVAVSVMFRLQMPLPLAHFCFTFCFMPTFFCQAIPDELMLEKDWDFMQQFDDDSKKMSRYAGPCFNVHLRVIGLQCLWVDISCDAQPVPSLTGHLLIAKQSYHFHRLYFTITGITVVIRCCTAWCRSHMYVSSLPKAVIDSAVSET